ncbi:MAG TPA: cytochrome c biogenesis heme-transporting ATPase CcmA [Burkholderiales bacterium]|nr:cytochrome c biogenesis heme-transporting ATPase CcmA [Burkholderiales bacterium]
MLEARNLECQRGGRVLFRGLSLAAAPGELLRIAGPNGAGKTSLLRILCGLLTPAAGEVRWRGAPIGALKEDYARHLVYLGHAPAVKDDLTATENLDIACRLAGVETTHRSLAEALGRFGVPEGPPLKRLSQGQRRRAALARLVLSAAVPLWLLDEPLTALDTGAAEGLERMLTEHAARGGAVVFTSHQDVRVEHARMIEL